MNVSSLSAGSKVPHEFNVVIEIPMHGAPVKYEMDKDAGLLVVDRFMGTSMVYPGNYGYVPKTLSEDGDPVDVIVVTPVQLSAGVMIACRAVGMLKMTDESGIDAKILAVPISKLTKMYDSVQKHTDFPAPFLSSIEHFFQHYKDLEAGKWVRIDGWDDGNAAQAEIMASIERYESSL